ncbi:hypothetical protein B0T20DRAFT_9064 [Sordaria brevicollis]|uniref:Uncharacterized protein n=1 Tax=Sordaria brevicollis TaxID=83679 RepID=A0AAE0UG23_SORBR|nr:hypothetical protein B0T20DRAFT_9064 [Sordaria brevicollis]
MPGQAQKSLGFWCTVCGKKFTRKEHLERHIPHHTGLKPFACNECKVFFGRQDLLRRHETIYHCIDNGSGPIRTRPGLYKDIACENCFKAKCQCDKQKPTCGACEKKGIKCVERISKRVVKQGARARRAQGSQVPPPPAQPDLNRARALSAPDVRNQHQVAMGTSMEDGMIGPNTYLEGDPDSSAPSDGLLADFELFNHLYGTYLNYSHEDLSFDPKIGGLGSRHDLYSGLDGLSSSSSVDIPMESINVDNLGGIVEMSGLRGYSGFTTMDNTHHHHLARHNRSTSVQHSNQTFPPRLSNLPHDFFQGLEAIPQPIQSNGSTLRPSGQQQDTFHVYDQISDNVVTFPSAISQEAFPHLEHTKDSIAISSPTSHQNLGFVTSHSVTSQASTSPSPPPSGRHTQQAGDKTTTASAELWHKLKSTYNNEPRAHRLDLSFEDFITRHIAQHGDSFKEGNSAFSQSILV